MLSDTVDSVLLVQKCIVLALAMFFDLICYQLLPLSCVYAISTVSHPGLSGLKPRMGNCGA